MKVLFTLFALVFSGFVAAKPLNNIVVFGDSLSDNGNLYEKMDRKLPQSPPYYEGRFTNGPVWVEQLVKSYFPTNSTAHLLDYAFGGAGISQDPDDDDSLFTLKSEMDTYLHAHQDKADENSLFIVWIGANNYLGVPDEVEKTLIDVNAGIAAGLQRLADAGAKHILVLNLPDLGQTPIAREFDTIEKLSYFANQHNELLVNTINELQRTHQDVQWLYFDVNQTLGDLVVSPEKYGFRNITDTCYDVIVEKPSQQSVLHMVANIKVKDEANICEGYLFFDPVHPTALAHKIMAEHARSFLDKAGVEFKTE